VAERYKRRQIVYILIGERYLGREKGEKCMRERERERMSGDKVILIE
jgi:hypothetical protein